MKIIKKKKIINKKAKETKKFVIKRELMFNNCKESLFDNKVILKSQQRFRSDHHEVYTEEVNKTALSSNDDKRIQASDKLQHIHMVWGSYMLSSKKITKNIYAKKIIK